MCKYKNKYFSILGDSISTFEGCSEPKGAAYYDMARKMGTGICTQADTWWGRVIDSLEGKLLANNSISGSTVCWNAAYKVPSYGCSDERTAALSKDGNMPNVIIVFLGANDWGAGTQVFNTQKAVRSEENLALFSNAYRKMLEKLTKNYPEAEIWCLTLPIGRCSLVENFVFPNCYKGRNISEYCKAICLAAEYYRCKVIDLHTYGTPYDTVDGFHPNASGMQTIAKDVLRILSDLP